MPFRRRRAFCFGGEKMPVESMHDPMREDRRANLDDEIPDLARERASEPTEMVEAHAPKSWKRHAVRAAAFASVAAAALVVVGGAAVAVVYRGLPENRSLNDYQPNHSTVVLRSADQ